MVLRTFCVPSLCPLRLKTSSEEKTAKQILILQNKNSRTSREQKGTILLGSQTLQNGTGIKLVFLRRWGVPKHGRALCIGCTVGQCKAPSGSALRQRAGVQGAQGRACGEMQAARVLLRTWSWDLLCFWHSSALQMTG